MNVRDVMIAALVAGAAYYVATRRASASTGGASSLLNLFFQPNGAIAVPAASQTSAQGQATIKAREGLKLTAYPDAGGYSIGYGHFITPGDGLSSTSTISTAQADQLFARDIGNVDDTMRRLITVALTQNEWDAVASLIYNIGVNAFAGSTLLSLLNRNDISGAAQQFMAWNMTTVNGTKTVSPALNNRRAQELAQFNSTGGGYA